MTDYDELHEQYLIENGYYNQTDSGMKNFCIQYRAGGTDGVSWNWEECLEFESKEQAWEYAKNKAKEESDQYSWHRPVNIFEYNDSRL